MKIIVLFTFLLLSSLSFASDDMTGNTWVFDSAGVKTSETTSIVWIWWTGITADGHQLAIYEYPSGKLIWKAKGKINLDLGVPMLGTSGTINGLEIRTLGSGEVLVRRGSTQ